LSERARIFAIEVLPVPARADEEVGVVDLVLLDRVAQGTNHVLLSDDLIEGARAVAAVEGGRLGHRGIGASVSTAPRRPR
jgi:hypothetical protein